MRVRVAHLSSVRVLALGLEAADAVDVLEGLVHEAAVAALVAEVLGAVHQLLLRQGDQHARLAEVLAL